MQVEFQRFLFRQQYQLFQGSQLAAMSFIPQENRYREGQENRKPVTLDSIRDNASMLAKLSQKHTTQGEISDQDWNDLKLKLRLTTEKLKDSDRRNHQLRQSFETLRVQYNYLKGKTRKIVDADETNRKLNVKAKAKLIAITDSIKSLSLPQDSMESIQILLDNLRETPNNLQTHFTFQETIEMIESCSQSVSRLIKAYRNLEEDMRLLKEREVSLQMTIEPNHWGMPGSCNSLPEHHPIGSLIAPIMHVKSSRNLPNDYSNKSKRVDTCASTQMDSDVKGLERQIEELQRQNDLTMKLLHISEKEKNELINQAFCSVNQRKEVEIKALSQTELVKLCIELQSTIKQMKMVRAKESDRYQKELKLYAEQYGQLMEKLRKLKGGQRKARSP